MPAVRRTGLVEAMWRWHRWVFRLSGGRLGSNLAGIPVLQLTTIGRKSGRPREVMLYFFRHLGGYVVVASHAGEPGNPPWYANLKASPRAVAQIGRTRVQIVARETSGEERDGLWTKAVELHPPYAEYQLRTERQIPVLVLEPVEGQ